MLERIIQGLTACMVCIALLGIASCSEQTTAGDSSSEEFFPKLVSANLIPDEVKVLNAVKDQTIVDLLGKTFDIEAERELYLNADRKDRQQHKLKSWDFGISQKLTVNNFIVTQNYFNMSKLYTVPQTMQSQIDNGFYAIIPRNPYTGEDIKSSLEYSPGDYYYVADNESLFAINHYGEYDSEFREQDNYDKLEYVVYQDGDDSSYVVTDGRSEYWYGQLPPEIIGSISKPNEKFSNKKFVIQKRIMWRRSQIQEIIHRYMDVHDPYPESFKEVIDFFGRLNPPAWINPYTGEPMRQMNQFAVCKGLWGEIRNIDRPEDPLKVKSEEYKMKYAGNYTFDIVKSNKGPDKYVVLCFYYLSDDGGADEYKHCGIASFQENGWRKENVNEYQIHAS